MRICLPSCVIIWLSYIYPYLPPFTGSPAGWKQFLLAEPTSYNNFKSSYSPYIAVLPSFHRFTWSLSTSGVLSTWCVPSTWRTCRRTRRGQWPSSTSWRGRTSACPTPEHRAWRRSSTSGGGSNRKVGWKILCKILNMTWIDLGRNAGHEGMPRLQEVGQIGKWVERINSDIDLMQGTNSRFHKLNGMIG